MLQVQAAAALLQLHQGHRQVCKSGGAGMLLNADIIPQDTMYSNVRYDESQKLGGGLQPPSPPPPCLHPCAWTLAFLSFLVTWNWKSWSSCTFFLFEIWVGSRYGLHLCAHSVITTIRWPVRCNWADHSLVKLILLFYSVPHHTPSKPLVHDLRVGKKHSILLLIWYYTIDVKLPYSKILGWSGGTQLSRSDQDL